MLSILSTEYNAEFDALEIYVAGCTRRCEGCHNPEAQAFGIGRKYHLWLRDNAFKLKNEIVKNVWILGGDLLCSSHLQVQEFLHALKRVLSTTTALWLWTGEESIENIPTEVSEYFQYIKTGSYKKDLEGYTVTSLPYSSLKLASHNQQLWKQSPTTGVFLYVP